MSHRTDNYPLRAAPDLLKRMAGCDQVHPSSARAALERGRLVFGLCHDMKWRPVKQIVIARRSFSSPIVYRILFEPSPFAPHYSRTFTKDGILLMEVPTNDQ